jgi:hypothetical protein
MAGSDEEPEPDFPEINVNDLLEEIEGMQISEPEPVVDEE